MLLQTVSFHTGDSSIPHSLYSYGLFFLFSALVVDSARCWSVCVCVCMCVGSHRQQNQSSGTANFQNKQKLQNEVNQRIQ